MLIEKILVIGLISFLSVFMASGYIDSYKEAEIEIQSIKEDYKEGGEYYEQLYIEAMGR